MSDLLEQSILELGQLISSNQISPRELLAACQANITRIQPQVNALITTHAPQLSPSTDSRLFGIPYVLKDAYVTKGVRTTAGSAVLADFIPPYSATVVDRLQASGALLLGKANMDAWGHGGSTENTDFQPTQNPYNLKLVAGGSGGGPAAAVATRMCLFAIGEDTGGSIRNPAAWCNITGLKVTYGLVSRYGSIAYASSLDTVGPTAKTALDCAVVLQAIAGHDPKDATTSSQPVPDYVGTINAGVAGKVIGLPREFFTTGIDPQIQQATLAVCRVLSDLGAKIVDVSLPSLEYAVSVYYLLAPSETSSNLARYDGIRYGTDRSKFSFETKRRIMIGTHALSSGYYDAYYLKAQQARTLIIADYTKVFTACDMILAPVNPTPPPEIGSLLSDPVKNMLADIFTVTANTSGIPAIAFPAGFTTSRLPIGVQLQGPMYSEATLLQAAHAYQTQTTWHHEKPSL
jgi:aspartyl-tRNA(Asn)/glutamyl-tRNA(Gln) amidotransferase subunit A